MKNQKGITLVALILIIVVLLVLAGISVSLVLSNEEKVPNNTSNEQDLTNNVGFEYQPEEGEMPEPPGDEEINNSTSFITTSTDDEATNEPVL